MAADTDNFNSLGANTELNGRTTSGGAGTWSAVHATGAILGTAGGTAVRSGSSGGRRVYLDVFTLAGSTHYSQALMTVTSAAKVSLGLVVNCVNSSNTSLDNRYIAYWFGGGPGWVLGKRVGGTESFPAGSNNTLSPATATRTARLYTDGANAILTVDGTTVHTLALDAGITGSYVGILNNFADVDSQTLEDWDGGDYSAPASGQPTQRRFGVTEIGRESVSLRPVVGRAGESVLSLEAYYRERQCAHRDFLRKVQRAA